MLHLFKEEDEGIKVVMLEMLCMDILKFEVLFQDLSEKVILRVHVEPIVPRLGPWFPRKFRCWLLSISTSWLPRLDQQILFRLISVILPVWIVVVVLVSESLNSCDHILDSMEANCEIILFQNMRSVLKELVPESEFDVASSKEPEVVVLIPVDDI